MAADTDESFREALDVIYDWPTLAEAKQLIGEVARDRGIAVRFCGNLRYAPVVQLWRTHSDTSGEPFEIGKPFAGLVGDACAWSVTDFYEAWATRLTEALMSRHAFDTGWYSVKKELHSARILRVKPNGRLFIEVSASMDEWPDLVDTAFWEATGKSAPNGRSALLQLGLCEAEADLLLNATVHESAEYAEIGGDCSVYLVKHLAYNVRFRKLCEELESLSRECNQLLEDEYDRVVETCKQRVRQIQER